MENSAEDQDESCSDKVPERHSNVEATRSRNTEGRRTRSQKQRLCRPAKGTRPEKFSNIRKKVQSVLDENSKGKKKGRKRTILVFYYRQKGKKKQKQETEKEEVEVEPQTSDNASSLPGSSQDPEPSALSPLRRVWKWFFL